MLAALAALSSGVLLLPSALFPSAHHEGSHGGGKSSLLGPSSCRPGQSPSPSPPGLGGRLSQLPPFTPCHSGTLWYRLPTSSPHRHTCS